MCWVEDEGCYKLNTLTPPCPQVCSKTPRGCLEPQIVPKPVYKVCPEKVQPLFI